MSNVTALKIDKFKKYRTSRQEYKKAMVPLVQWMYENGAKSITIELPEVSKEGLANVQTSVIMAKP